MKKIRPYSFCFQRRLCAKLKAMRWKRPFFKHFDRRVYLLIWH